MGLAGYRELLKSETSVKICAMGAGLPVTRRIDPRCPHGEDRKSVV